MNYDEQNETYSFKKLKLISEHMKPTYDVIYCLSNAVHLGHLCRGQRHLQSTDSGQ